MSLELYWDQRRIGTESIEKSPIFEFFLAERVQNLNDVVRKKGINYLGHNFLMNDHRLTKKMFNLFYKKNKNDWMKKIIG